MTVVGEPASSPGGASAATPVRFAPMRWWHIAEAMERERELFGAEAWTAAAYWAELAQPETRYYRVVLDRDRVVGYAGLALFGAESHVLTLGVALPWQRRGLGAALLRDLLAQAARQRARTVLLDVRADNPVAQRLYARNGFVPVGRRRRYYQPSGVDAVVMRRDA